MSKKFLKLFALVAVFTLVMAGSAFAATVSWKTSVNEGDWSDVNNWELAAVPTAADVAVFPSNVTKVHVKQPATPVGRIRIDAGANVQFNILNGVMLTISLGNAVTAPAIEGAGNAVFSGQGEITFAAPATFVSVAQGVKVEMAVRATTNALMIKADKGTWAFTSDRDNILNAGGITIQDGELQIARTGHIAPTPAPVTFDTLGVQGRAPILTTTWTNSQAFTWAGKLTATTNGTLNIAGIGSTLVIRDTAAVVTGANRTITKKGVGTLQLDSNNGMGGIAPVWDAGVNLSMSEGNVVFDGTYVFDEANNLTIGADTRLTINKKWENWVNELAGVGTLQLLETSRFHILAPSTFPGYITGAGNLEIGDTGNPLVGGTGPGVATATDPVSITGDHNDYTGDTLVTVGSRLIINHEKNLGGSKRSRVYLSPLDGRVTNATETDYARLEVADGRSFILPNHLYIGDGAAAGSMRSVGGAIVIVPIDTRLEIANDITYNQNFLTKWGEGELFISSLGYDCVGDGSYEMDAANSVALQILNGKVRIENAKAAALGDILVDNGGSNANRPILSIRNGLKMSNNIFFTDQATFQTELIDANLAEGTTVQSAVEVGKVFFHRTYVINPATNNPGVPPADTGIVYNRVAFDQLSTSTVTKGQDFQLMKAVGYINYDAPKVEPDAWDGQVKAPFDPYFSTVYLYFKATHDIDVPVIGTPNTTKVKPGAQYSIIIPVTTTTGMKPGSATVNGLTGASIFISGNNLQIAGTAPATEQVMPYRVSVSSLGNVSTSTLEFESYRDFALVVTSADTPAGTITINGLTQPTSAAAGDTFTVTGQFSPVYPNVTPTFNPASAASDWQYNNVTGGFSFNVTMPSSNFTWSVTGSDAMGNTGSTATQTVTLSTTPIPTTGLSVTATSTTSNSVTGTVTYIDASGNPASGKSVKVTAQKGTETPLSSTVTTGTDGKATYTISGMAASSSYSISAIDTNDGTVTSSTITATTKSSSSSSGGGGCDAGFAGLALLLAAPLFLRKKD